MSKEQVTKRKIALLVLLVLLVPAVVVVIPFFLKETKNGDSAAADENNSQGNITESDSGVTPSAPSQATTSPSTSFVPTRSGEPSNTPSISPEPSISTEPTSMPSLEETMSLNPTTSKAPSQEPSLLAENIQKMTETIVYAIADVPYTVQEEREYQIQVQSVPKDADFMVHLGDIKRGGWRCSREYLEEVRDALRQSPSPVFLVMGDNEYTDCSDEEEALEDWRVVFSGFEDEWEHEFNVTRMEDREETFAFVFRRTLYVGLNMIGGDTFPKKWEKFLKSQMEWTVDLIEMYTQEGDYPQADGVVFFGHTSLNNWYQSNYFDGLSKYIRDLSRRVPMLYVCGDQHEWLHQQRGFLGRSALSRIRLTGGTSEPPLKVIVNPSFFPDDNTDAFQYERFWIEYEY